MGMGKKGGFGKKGSPDFAKGGFGGKDFSSGFMKGGFDKGYGGGTVTSTIQDSISSLSIRLC